MLDCSVCHICGSNNIKDVFPLVKDYITGESFRIQRCGNCDVCFTNPMPDNTDPYYPAKYRKYGAFAMYLLKYFYRLRVERWLKTIASPGSALEIGCGAGFMLDVLQKKGWNVMGLERTEIMATKARSTFGLNVIACDIEYLPKEKNFDLIILFNVLEHIHAPLSILKECLARLKPNACVIISTHNFASWQSSFGKDLWLHLDPPRHLFHFTPKTMEKLLNIVGLEICDINFISYEHDPYGWIQSIINKITGDHNTLTRYLMGFEKFNFDIALSAFLGLVLIIPAIILSMASWIRRSGALMQIIAAPSKAGNIKELKNRFNCR